MTRLLAVTLAALGCIILAIAFASLGCEERRSPDELVQSGVQSVTICERHDVRIWAQVTEEVPKSDVGVWLPKKEGDCQTWYHYSRSAE
jgi:hypothetical protein